MVPLTFPCGSPQSKIAALLEESPELVPLGQLALTVNVNLLTDRPTICRDGATDGLANMPRPGRHRAHGRNHLHEKSLGSAEMIAMMSKPWIFLHMKSYGSPHRHPRKINFVTL